MIFVDSVDVRLSDIFPFSCIRLWMTNKYTKITFLALDIKTTIPLFIQEISFHPEYHFNIIVNIYPPPDGSSSYLQC